MTKPVRLAAAMSVAAILLSACSGGGKGLPAGGASSSLPSLGSSSSAASSTGSSSGAAPRVPAALPVNKLLGDPCGAISAQQAYQIGLNSTGAPHQFEVGPGCTWKSATSTLNSVAVIVASQGKNGLSDIYAHRLENKYFVPTSVTGYPAVYADTSDNRSSGDCSLWVGVTDQLAVAVLPGIGEGPNKSNPCPIAEKVAAAMIQHLQGAA